MKLGRAIGTAVLSLTLGVGISAYAQQEQHEQEESKDKPAQAQDKKAQPEKTSKPGAKNADRKNNNKPAERNAQQHQQPAQRAGGGRIPDARYKANFGQAHTFRVNQGDYHNHRFQYGGYSFGFVGAWPSNWLYTQNVYVIDIGGVYYLCNPMYPGVNVELSVTL
ncbi:MAG: hypothetical protein WA252_18710 [Candidatus Sulfotelmatobacter sp.]